MFLTSDVRYAVRVLSRSPVFTITAVLSLAIGMAATTAIFSLADALLLRPRTGVTDPATLVDIGRSTGGAGLDNFGYPLFLTLRDRSTLLEGLSAAQFTPNVMALGDATSSERVYASLVSGNYFEIVGTRPGAGRFFRGEEDRTRGTHPVVVLSHQFWTRRFGADPALIGQTIRLNNLPYTVVGIAQDDGFTGTTLIGSDLWVPFAMDAHVRAADGSLLDRNEAVWMTSVGRLKPGVSVQQARDELSAILKNFMKEQNDDRINRWDISVAPSARVPMGLAAPVLGFIALLAALTGLVLLIACSNVAAMLLARALERRREVATRLAIGASRRRILGQLLVEGLTLGLIGGALSIPLSAAAIGLLSSRRPDLPIPLAIEPQIDPRVLAFTLSIAVLTSVLFALLPALHTTQFDVASALHGQNATADRRRGWLRHGLVAAQVAMALLLLVAAGLFIRSLQKAATVDAGFNAERVDTLHVDTRIAGYRTDADGARVIDALENRFRQIPGILAVGASRMVPLQGGGLGLGGLRAPGYAGSAGSDSVENVDWDVVSPGYFDAIDVRVTRGRTFTASDRAGSPWVAIINDSMAAHLWPGQNPLGKTLLQQDGPDEVRSLEIVGVARNAKYRSIGEGPRNFIYVPLAQQFLSDITFYVKRASDVSRLNDLRAALVAFDPNLPVIHTQTLEEATAIGLLPQRLAAWIAGTVGIIGLLLAALGLYGLTAFSVAQRTREIAVRMALGATRDVVLSLVLRQSARLALAGAAVGLALAVGMSVMVNSLLVGVGSIDPYAFGLATALLSGVLLAATWVPARRAARMDPMRALRAE
ncbi:MAG: ABC transporter permease [Acidobacteria bacterium]|nr:ABC transporter permease [Acidobacteriota bacterium]